MNDKVLGELLVVSLIFISSARIFFVRRVKVDALAFFALLSFPLAALLVLCWGITIPECLLLALSFLAFTFNLRAMMRLFAGLVIDHYSVAFIVFAAIMLITSLALGCGIVLLRQVPVSAQRFAVEETRYMLERAADGTLRPADETDGSLRIRHVQAAVSVFKKSDADKEAQAILPALLFVPDPRSYVEDYRPLLIKLAARGYTVIAADFFTDDNKWFGSCKDTRIFRRAAFRIEFLKDAQFAAHNKSKLEAYTQYEYAALLSLCGGAVPEHIAGFWLLGDEASAAGMHAEKERYRSALKASQDEAAAEADEPDGFSDLSTEPVLIGALDISAVEGSTAGFGSVEQTDPWTAKLLKKDRDRTLYSADHLARNIQLKLQATFHD